MTLIRKMSDEYHEYLRDESRSVGNASSISFPYNEQEIRDILSLMNNDGISVTVQGGRTGLAAGAVPREGHIINLSKMNKVIGMWRDNAGSYHLTLESGVVLSELRKMISSKRFDTRQWDKESQKAFNDFLQDREQFFPPDPTEASATIGGMLACNASGARSYYYGSTREHIYGLKVVLANGETITLVRDKFISAGRTLSLTTDQGSKLIVDLPSYDMPDAKNASGYYIKDNMDAIDLFIGSDGTLGIITEIDIILTSTPQEIWGITCFFRDETAAIDFVTNIKTMKLIAAIEFFDYEALNILRKQRAEKPAFAKLQPLEPDMHTAIYIEIHSDDEELALQELRALGEVLDEVGGSKAQTWVARNDADRDSLYFFRHAVPESVNMLIDERKKLYPSITKLGTDMSVPNEYLKYIVDVYRNGLKSKGLQSAVWGHVGDNHLHVNILPRNQMEYDAGKSLIDQWAHITAELGGAISAEHGVGKLKAKYLKLMYSDRCVEEMTRMKAVFDPNFILSIGNLFDLR